MLRVSGGATQITSGDDWNDTDPQWSPDGRRIAFVSDRSGHEFDESYDTDIWVINRDGGQIDESFGSQDRGQLRRAGRPMGKPSRF